VEALNLKKTYSGKVDVPVLFGIDLQVRAAEFVAVIGPSGSGKTTLLNLLGALDLPTTGNVMINGVDTSTLAEDDRAMLRNDEVGFIFRGCCLLDEFSCVENVLMPLTIRQGKPTDEQRERALLLLNRVGLGDQFHKHPDQMTGGQNQQCAIARALAHQPKIVLADEPTGDLDRRSANRLLETMRQMNRETGVAFLLVTHDERLAQAADRILLIEDGVIQGIGKDHRGPTVRRGPNQP
jgi:ABC-type lipoprotein export system ATPase subunit